MIIKTGLESVAEAISTFLLSEIQEFNLRYITSYEFHLIDESSDFIHDFMDFFEESDLPLEDCEIVTG